MGNDNFGTFKLSFLERLSSSREGPPSEVQDPQTKGHVHHRGESLSEITMSCCYGNTCLAVS